MNRLKQPLDVKFINRTFFPNDLNNVSAINDGRCFLWAYVCFHFYKNVQLWTYGSHAFVRYKSKFYDSETFKGVKDWRKLPATRGGRGCGCRICCQPAERQTVNEFKKPHNWGNSAKNKNIKWKDVRLQVQRVKEQVQ